MFEINVHHFHNRIFAHRRWKRTYSNMCVTSSLHFAKCWELNVIYGRDFGKFKHAIKTHTHTGIHLHTRAYICTCWKLAQQNVHTAPLNIVLTVFAQCNWKSLLTKWELKLISIEETFSYSSHNTPVTCGNFRFRPVSGTRSIFCLLYGIQ